MIEVELPDGRVLEVPTDDPAAAARAGKAFLRREQDPQGSQRALTIGTQGVGRGLADIAGTPVDLTTAAINGVMSIPRTAANLGIAGVNAVSGAEIPYVGPEWAPRIEKPVGGSDWIAEKFGQGVEAAGGNLVEYGDMGGGEAFAYNANRFGTGGLATGAGVARMGLKAADAGASVPAIAAPYVEAVVKNGTAIKPLMVDTAQGLGAAAGYTATEGSDSPLAQFAATILGGYAGGKGAQGALDLRNVPDTFRYYLGEDPTIPVDPVTGQSVSRYTGDVARDVLQGEAIDPRVAATNIRQGVQAYEDADMAVPTSGLLSNDEGVLGVEKAARTRKGAPFIRNDRNVQQGAADKLATLDPGPGVDPRQATAAATSLAQGPVRAAQSAVNTAEHQFNAADLFERALGGQLAGAAGGADDASRLLDQVLIERTMRPMQAQQDALYNAIPTDIALDAGPLVAQADAIANNAPQGIRPPSLAPFDRNALVVADAAGSEVPTTITSGDVRGMRPQLSSAVKSARSQGDFARADALSSVKRTAEGMIDQLPEAQEAVRYTRDEFGPLFGQGEGGRFRKDINQDDLARTKTPPTRTASRFLGEGPGSSEKAADLARILKASPAGADGRKAVRAALMADMAGVVGTDGKVRPDALRQWMVNRQGVLDAFPAVRTEVEAMSRDVANRRAATTRLQQALEAAQGNLKTAAADADKSALALFIDTDPTKAIGKVFGSDDPTMAMREIVAKLGKDRSSPEWLGLKKATADYLSERVTNTGTFATAGGDRPVSLAKIENMLKQHEKVLTEIYTPDEMRAVKQMHRAVRDLGMKSLKVSTGSNTPEDLAQMDRIVELALKGFYGQLVGGSKFRAYKLARAAVPALNEGSKVMALLDRAMLDPRVAATLLETPTTRPERLAWNKRISDILGVSTAAREAVDEE